MSRHIVFGTGQVGHPLATHLASAGHDVIAVNRGGRGSLAGARTVGGDATDAAFTSEVCAGADAVYFCLNAPHYERWIEEFPPLQRGVLAGARAAGSRLVVLENLYSYGPPQGRPLVESMPASPTSAKSATRAAMTEELLAAHGTGDVEVAIGRASDYFGPGALRSALGETVFEPALRGRTAQVMGRPDQPHSYSFTSDVAAGLATLGTQRGATGEVWHLPVDGAPTTRDLVERVFALAGTRPRLMAAGALTLRALGTVKPAMREYLHTLYQFTDPWIVDDSKFRDRFQVAATPVDDALSQTLAWFRDHTAVPA